MEKGNLKKRMLACLYPPHCPVCGELLIPWESSTCPECAGRLHFVGEPVCMCCGQALSDETKEYCSRCEKEQRPFLRNFAVWEYDKWMKKSITQFKYCARKEYTGFYIRHMACRYGEQLKRYGVTALVPVPISKKRERQRGYNQAELLSFALSKELGLLDARLLRRIRNTVPQKNLSPEERKQNLVGAIVWNKKKATALKELPEAVAVVDDVYTTGSTIAECARVLRENGVKRVYSICICIGKE